MGDWEDIFGAGVSAESVIDGLKSDAEYEQEEERRNLRRKEREKRKALTAYHGNPSIKLALISQLQDLPWHKHNRKRGPLAVAKGSYAVVEH